MIEQLDQQYVIAARAKGCSELQVVWHHAFPNILVPLLTVIGSGYASLLEGAVLTETVFAWPGLGRYLTQAVFSADMNAVLGGTLLIGTIFIGINLSCDLLYRSSIGGPAQNRLMHKMLAPWFSAQLGDESPSSSFQARIIGVRRGLSVLAGNGMALCGLVIVLLALMTALCAPLIAPRCFADRPKSRGAACGAERCPLVRNGRIGAGHIRACSLRGQDNADHRAVGRCDCCADRPARRQRGRLFRRNHRCAPDASDGHVPRISQPDPGAGLLRRTGAGHRECHCRHRPHGVATLCQIGAGRDDPAGPQRLHRGDPPARGIRRAHHFAPYRAALPVVGCCAPHSRYGRDGVDGGRSRVSRARRAAAGCWSGER